MRVRSTWLLLTALGCAGSPSAEYMRTEAGFLRVGVDRTAELSQVKRVLAQRGLHATTERYSLSYVALGAASEEQRATAIRVISSRGVVFAQDASLDDLFQPSRLELVDTLPESLDDMELFAFSRIAKGYELGCITLGRVLPDGTAVPFGLDVSQLGEWACVSALRNLGKGNLLATVSWPSLSVPEAPATLDVVLALDRPRLDRPAPLVRSARVDANSELIERETQRLSSLPNQPTFGERQAIAVGRAALALLRGEDADRQLGAYREALGSVRSGSHEHRIAEDTAAHIARGWLAEQRDDNGQSAAEQGEAQVPRSGASEVGQQAAEDDALVIEPEPASGSAPEPQLAPATEGQ